MNNVYNFTQNDSIFENNENQNPNSEISNNIEKLEQLIQKPVIHITPNKAYSPSRSPVKMIQNLFESPQQYKPYENEGGEFHQNSSDLQRMLQSQRKLEKIKVIEDIDPVYRQQKFPQRDRVGPQPAEKISYSNYPRFPDVSYIRNQEKIDFWTKPQRELKNTNNEKRKLPAFIMVNLFPFLTLDKIINQTCKLTKNDRQKLADNRHILKQQKTLNVKFNQHPICKNLLEYYLKFCNDINLSFFEFDHEHNKGILKFIVKEYRDLLIFTHVTFYVAKVRLVKKDIFPISKCFGTFKSSIRNIKIILSPLSAKGLTIENIYDDYDTVTAILEGFNGGKLKTLEYIDLVQYYQYNQGDMSYPKVDSNLLKSYEQISYSTNTINSDSIRFLQQFQQAKFLEIQFNGYTQNIDNNLDLSESFQQLQKLTINSSSLETRGFIVSGRFQQLLSQFGNKFQQLIFVIQDSICLSYIFSFITQYKIKDIVIKSDLVTGHRLFDKGQNKVNLKSLKTLKKNYSLNLSHQENGYTFTLTHIQYLPAHEYGTLVKYFYYTTLIDNQQPDLDNVYSIKIYTKDIQS